jgi:hypothetical protein
VNANEHGVRRRRGVRIARGPRDARGETLVEVLVAISIIGVGVVGLLAALGATFHFSSRSRVDAHGDGLLVRYAEALAAAPYEACGAGGPPYQGEAEAAIPSTGLPDGITTGPWGSGDGTARSFELTVESTTYWDGDTAGATFSNVCGPIDLGCEQLHVRVRSGDGSFDRRLVLTKRAA